MITILEHGMAESMVRSLDPFLTAINILGVCTFYFNVRENLKYLDPTRQLLSVEAILQGRGYANDRQVQAAIDLIWAGIKA
jgi:TetR/AcrR family transcriptional regulator